MITAGGWSAKWKYGVGGTNLAGTPEQKRTWYLWGYNPRGGQAILATVRKEGGAYDARNAAVGGRLVATIRGANALSKAKRRAEAMFGMRKTNPTHLNPITYATMDNLKKHQGKRGLVMFSPYTGEEYSANIGDYFWAPPNARFKDSTGHVMRLGIGQPATVKALNPGVPGPNPKGMTAYTQWAIKYPWHVSDVPYPRDKHGNCTCGCKYCLKMYTHKATRRAHLNLNPVMVPAQASAAQVQTQSYDISHMNPKLERGNWPPYNVKYIVRNVQSVFKHRDIRKLSQGAYKFITLHMGFIAHYNLYGFQDSYQNLEQFAKTLQTSEYSNDYDYNLLQAQRQETDRDFDKWYGSRYNKSVAEGIRGIAAVAHKYYPSRGTQRMFNPRESNLSRKDFNVKYDSRGYMILYKGKPIGGAGILREAKGPRGRAATAQARDYLREAQVDIDALIQGRGQRRFYEAIAKIRRQKNTMNPRVKSVPMSKTEYRAFVKYLNANRIQQYTTDDVIQFLRAFTTDKDFRKAWS